MGFRLSSFLGGMAEGAIEIEENVRKRNEKIIDSTMEANANRREEERRLRKEKEQEYKLLAKKLSGFEGMDAGKINLVLSYGINEARTFAEKAPEIAAIKRLTVADLVELSDPNAQTIDPEVFISQGNLIDMPQYTPMSAPVGLRKSPILGRDYTKEYEQTSGDFYEGLGISSDADIEVKYDAPEGRIRYEDMFAPARPEIDKFSANQAFNQMQIAIADRLGVGATYTEGPDGSRQIQLESDDKDLVVQARTLARDAFSIYNNSLRSGAYRADYDQDLAIQNAVQGIFGNNMAVTPSVRDAASTDDSTQASTTATTTTAPASLDQQIANTRSPAVLAQLLKQQAEAQGQSMTNQQANDEAKRILDERKANAQ